ncbi:MAG TPA: tetratricopeptide repeat protein [Puia sp.]|nr:tetratricopeptide repeat protein [Puia sp.]
MKRLLFTALTIFLMGGSKAQSLAGAQKMLDYGRYDGAAHQLHVLLQTDPANTEAWWLLSQVYVHQRRLPALRDTLRYLPAAVTGQPMALCARGLLFLALHQKDSARTRFDQALAETKQKDPHVLLAVATADETDPADTTDARHAIDLLNKAIRRDKHNPRLYIALGDAWRRLLDGGSAYKAYSDALAQDSRSVDAMFRLGKIFVSQNNPDMYLKYFNEAVAADSTYAPAWYELYYHYYFRDVYMAKRCLDHYIAASDPSLENDYLLTDLLYASRQYTAAINHAQQLIARQGSVTEPRLYKLIAYSYKELHDSITALDYMKRYFGAQTDTGFVEKDYETMGEIYSMLGRPDSAAVYYVKAGTMEKDSIQRIAFAKKLADLYKDQKDYSSQAMWLGKYYMGNTRATNLDLFNWGLAHYMAKEYPRADSVFGLYETKYPDQDFGFYWRARCDAAIDTAMTSGMAVPQYTKLIEIDEKDTASKLNRKHLIEAYGYIAAYKANTEKDYSGSIGYFEKLLTLDPGNKDAERYVAILKKNLSRMEAAAQKQAAARQKEAGPQQQAGEQQKEAAGTGRSGDR